MPHDAASYQFTRQQRLLKASDFARVFASKKPFFTRHFVVHASENPLNHARIGLVVSKKVSKKAVQRNQIKRQIRNAFRLGYANLAPLDFVVVARSNCVQALVRASEVDLQSELNYIFKKISSRYG